MISPKIIVISITMVTITALAAGYTFFQNQQQSIFNSVCKKNHEKYTKLCLNINKQAYTNTERKRLIGGIKNITWQETGSTISRPNHEIRTSLKSEYYYIIGSSKSNYLFLAPTSAITAQ